jgi:hypothetical protein
MQKKSTVDYYQGDKRVGQFWLLLLRFYSHSKAICDRLNNSSLENIVTMNGYEIILVEIKKELMD